MQVKLMLKRIERVGDIATRHDSFSISKVKDNGDKTYTLECKKILGKFEQAFYYRVCLMLSNLFEKCEESGEPIYLEKLPQDVVKDDLVQITYKEIN